VVPPLQALSSRSTLFLVGALGAVVLGLLAGAVHLSFHGGAGERVRKALGILLVVSGTLATINFVLTPKITLRWMDNEPAGLARARLDGKPLVVDFTADWCLPCKEMEVSVFSNPDVAAEMENFVLVRVDVTREDESETVPALKQRYGVDTLPALRFVAPAGQIVGRVDKLLSWQEFLGQLQSARVAVSKGN
jgi:thiol:disulfide interchange protein DsbD